LLMKRQKQKSLRPREARLAFSVSSTPKRITSGASNPLLVYPQTPHGGLKYTIIINFDL